MALATLLPYLAVHLRATSGCFVHMKRRCFSLLNGIGHLRGGGISLNKRCYDTAEEVILQALFDW